MERTKILNVGANSGTGGWLDFNMESGNFTIEGYDLVSKAKSSLWSIIVLQNDDNSK